MKNVVLALGLLKTKEEDVPMCWAAKSSHYPTERSKNYEGLKEPSLGETKGPGHTQLWETVSMSCSGQGWLHAWDDGLWSLLTWVQDLPYMTSLSLSFPTCQMGPLIVFISVD